jgi:hypothetical protein
LEGDGTTHEPRLVALEHPVPGEPFLQGSIDKEQMPIARVEVRKIGGVDVAIDTIAELLPEGR